MYYKNLRSLSNTTACIYIYIYIQLPCGLTPPPCQAWGSSNEQSWAVLNSTLNFVLLFVFWQHNQWTLSAKLMNNCSKICLKSTKKELGGCWKGGQEPKWLLEGVKSLRKTKTIVRGPPLETFIGSHLRAWNDPEAVQKRFWRSPRGKVLGKPIFEGCH